MGLPTAPREEAPAYDDVFPDHPVNGYPASRSGYATVPQDDDIELNAHEHTHNQSSSSATPAPPNAPESFVQTIASALRPKPHVHCEQCDVQLAARQRRENEKHCCTMVAATFMVGFLCLFFGIVIASSIWRKRH